MERQKRKQEEEQQYLLRQQLQQLQQAQGMQPHLQTHMSQISQTHMYAGQGVHSAAQGARAWRSYEDKATGRMYYHNTITKVTQWDRPPCFDVPQQQASVLKSPVFVI